MKNVIIKKPPIDGTLQLLNGYKDKKYEQHSSIAHSIIYQQSISFTI